MINMSPFDQFLCLTAAVVAFLVIMAHLSDHIVKGLYWVAVWIAYAFFSVYFWIKKRIKGVINFFRGVVGFIRIIRAENDAEYEPHDPYIQMRRKHL